MISLRIICFLVLKSFTGFYEALYQSTVKNNVPCSFHYNDTCSARKSEELEVKIPRLHDRVDFQIPHLCRNCPIFVSGRPPPSRISVLFTK